MLAGRQKGRLVARAAQGPADLDRALALRQRCFRTGQPGGAGRDRDRFDDLCRHMLVEEAATGRLLACYRWLDSDFAGICDSYSGQFYDLRRLTPQPGRVLELGRFCLDPAVQDPDVLRLAWASLTAHAMAAGVWLLYGCSSFAGADPGRHAAALAHLARHHLAPPDRQPGRKAPATLALRDDPALPPPPASALPPLLRSYLAMGGQVSDHAVLDHDLDTLHVLTLVDVARIPAARVRALMALAEQG